MTAWRINKAKYIATAFDGTGSKKAGGRWNSIGTSMVYTSESLALATLEASVHLPSYELLKIYQCISIRFDKAMVMEPDLPEEWNLHPPGPPSQFLGDQWIKEGQSAVLQVPSIIIPGESNFLINPNHPNFAKMTIGAALDYPYDSRLHKT
ncbi:MAG: RES family NAD+ phosphorylase [Desulfobacteraceae bacterium]|nr:RES family NAD+ phosphorylase [Desulfobacteraceae bacterium]